MRRGLSLNQFCVRVLEGFGRDELVGNWSGSSSFLPSHFLQQLVVRWESELVGIVLFGSRARGESTAGSDIDLLLVFNPGFRLSRRLYTEWDSMLKDSLEETPRREISPHFVVLPAGPVEAGGLWYEIAIEGTVVWEQALRVSRLLTSIRKAMIRGDIERAIIHGHPYWIKRKRRR